MPLSHTERWILANQYLILEKLDPNQASHYEEVREALENGYEIEINSFAQHIYDGDDVMTRAEAKEVMDILDLYRVLRRAYDQMEDKTGIEPRDVVFDGFDGNDETKLLAYHEYLYKRGKWRETPPRNSHGPFLDYYRRLLAAWSECQDKYHPTKEEVQRILAAGPIT